MGENTIRYFHGTEKEQALLKQERFRVDCKGDFLVDTMNLLIILGYSCLGLFLYVYLHVSSMCMHAEGRG